jgi:cytochrome o ubiquinol oxidase operon protein cyoD
MLDREHGWNISLKPSVIGYVLSLLLIAGMYRLVVHRHLTGSLLMWTVFVFGIIQALLQLVFFLHLGMESKPHWNSITFLFAVLVIVIVIGGSMWIMQNLSYNVMLPKEHG